MRIPLDWLGTLVDLSGVDPDVLSSSLTLGLCEVEKVERATTPYKGVVVGKIQAVHPHPQADRLRLATVRAGGGELQIVCGAPNIAPGQTVPVALPGAELPGEDGKPFKIKLSKIRGVESAGMLCSQEELGLGNEHEGILQLESSFPEGTPLESALGAPAPVLVIDNKSLTHRADCWGLRGLAREVAAILGRPLKVPPGDLRTLSGPPTYRTEVLAPSSCPLYRVVGLRGVAHAESPVAWKRRLEAAGMRAVNAIVDATNLAMLETAQPLHAFDAAKVKGPVKVRLAREGEPFVTLDGVARKLLSSDLVICDGDTPVALAGVMGGASTAVTEGTTSILLEGATFDAATIRRTSQRLGLRSESSARFEKSLPPILVEEGLARCVELLKEVFPGLEVCHGLEPLPSVAPRTIQVDAAWIASRLGVSLEASKAGDKLRSIGFGVALAGTNLTVTVPPWRSAKDISLPEDLLEEVARLLPLESITPRLPSLPARPASVAPSRLPERRLRSVLAACGAREILSYSFARDSRRQDTGEDDQGLKLRNPIQSDMASLRRTLMGGMLDALERNHRQRDALHLFEIGRVYFPEKEGVREETRCAGLVKAGATSWHAAKRDIEAILETFGIRGALWERLEDAACAWAHPGRLAQVRVGKLVLGRLSEVHPRILESMDCEGRAAAWEMDLDILRKVAGGKPRFRELPRYPVVRRDLALLVPESVAVADVETVFAAGKRPLLNDVELFDIYRGKGLPAESKSLAFRLHWLDPEKTLTDERIRELETALVSECQARGWSRR
ncbi:MAG: phenylalanine--tRNA ligase subunit beta [Planctomycetota bacterium]